MQSSWPETTVIPEIRGLCAIKLHWRKYNSNAQRSVRTSELSYTRQGSIYILFVDIDSHSNPLLDPTEAVESSISRNFLTPGEAEPPYRSTCFTQAQRGQIRIDCHFNSGFGGSRLIGRKFNHYVILHNSSPNPDLKVGDLKRRHTFTPRNPFLLLRSSLPPISIRTDRLPLNHQQDKGKFSTFFLRSESRTKRGKGEIIRYRTSSIWIWQME